jgi:hypothetical protein
LFHHIMGGDAGDGLWHGLRHRRSHHLGDRGQRRQRLRLALRRAVTPRLGDGDQHKGRNAVAKAAHGWAQIIIAPARAVVTAARPIIPARLGITARFGIIAAKAILAARPRGAAVRFRAVGVDDARDLAASWRRRYGLGPGDAG